MRIFVHCSLGASIVEGLGHCRLGASIGECFRALYVWSLYRLGFRCTA